MKGKWGYRRLTAYINHHCHSHYKHKRIRRILLQLGLRATIRWPSHSCMIAKGQNYEPNILNRDFTAAYLNEKWVTNVTYLNYGEECKAYLSAIKDPYNGEIIAYVVGKRNDNQLVMNTLKQACAKFPNANPLLHSDRGFQYISKKYARFTTEYGITRMVSVLIMPQWRAFGVTIRMKLTITMTLKLLKIL